MKKRMFSTILFGLLIGYIILAVFAYLIQGRMVYFPVREIAITPESMGVQYEDIVFMTEDSRKIAAWYIPSAQDRGTILFCHGNAGNISHRLDSIRIFHRLGLAVLIFDYRGYGKSDGTPTEKGTYRDAAAAWDYLVKVKHERPEKIIIFGRSLGSAVAAELALRTKAGALILESGFTSVPELGKKFYPYLPVRLLSRFRYATIDKVHRINMPKLVIHSPQDEIVPFEQGRLLFEKASEPKTFLQISGGHNEGFITSGETYIEGLEKFFGKYLDTNS